MINELRNLNNKLLYYYKEDRTKLKRHKLIGRILEDDRAFFKMDIEYAYAILRDLGIQENKLREIYMILLDD